MDLAKVYKILIVNDNSREYELIASYLTENGYMPLHATNSNDAFKVYHSQKPHIIIIDLQLPDDQGLKFRKKIRKNGSTFSDDLETYICHMILSHHGRYEYGSPNVPKITEAMVLFQADFMDSQVKNFIQHMDDQRQNTDESWAYVWDGDLGMKKPLFLKNIKEEID